MLIENDRIDCTESVMIYKTRLSTYVPRYFMISEFKSVPFVYVNKH